MSTVFKCDRCGKLFDPLKKKKKKNGWEYIKLIDCTRQCLSIYALVAKKV